MLEHAISGEFSKRTGNHIAWYAPYGEFTTADGNLVLAVTRQEEFEALCRVLGKPELAKDPRFADNNARVQNREALIEEIQSVTSQQGRYDLENRLAAAGVPAAAVQSLREFDEDPKSQELHVIEKIHQEGVGAYTVSNTPIRFSRTPVDPDHSAPSFPGSNSREVLTALGYQPEKIEELLASGAVHQPT